MNLLRRFDCTGGVSSFSHCASFLSTLTKVDLQHKYYFSILNSLDSVLFFHTHTHTHLLLPKRAFAFCIHCGAIKDSTRFEATTKANAKMLLQFPFSGCDGLNAVDLTANSIAGINSFTISLFSSGI